MAKIATFAVMIVFWLVLSGMFDAFHTSLGLFCALLVAQFGHNLLFFSGNPRTWTIVFFGMVLYLPSLFWEILLANLQVAYIACHPRMLELIDPQVIRFRTKLRTRVSRVALGQSITLTPGTITVDIRDDEFTVYALTRSAARGCPGAMEERIGKIVERPLR